MVFLLLFTGAVLLISAVVVWPRVGRLPSAAQPWREHRAGPASDEGILVARLAAGEITHGQYLAGMEKLAGGSSATKLTS
jgi:uncharacterized membrane protein